MAGAPAKAAVSRVAPPAGPLSMGFVDMEKVIENHPQAKVREEELRQQLKAPIEELRQTAEKAREIEGNLDLLTEGSPEYLDRLRQIRNLKASVELDEKILRAESQLKLVEAMKKMYKEMPDGRGRGGAGAQPPGRGHVHQRPDQCQTGTDFVNDVITRPFIWHDQSLDITSEVMDRLKAK